MSFVLDANRRAALAALAVEILPGSDNQPGAADIEIDGAPLDRVLRARPDLVAGLCRVLDRYNGEADNYLRTLEGAEFNLLMTVICAAYVMDTSVCRALGYDGQQALSPHRGGFGAEDLVIEMMQQPKRFRRV